MIVFENGSWQSNSMYPDTNFLENEDRIQPKWVVPDNSELAEKIKDTPYWEPVQDEEGNLTGIIPLSPPEPEVTVAELKSELEEIDKQAIRPLRAIAAGTDTEEDRETLAELERQAEAVRSQLAELEGDK